MSIPDYQSLMAPVLRLASRGEHRVSEAVAALADELGLTSEERAGLLPSGRQALFANRVHWAKTYLTKAGLLSSPGRGRFAITDRGRQVLSEGAERIDNRLLARFEEFRRFARQETDRPTSEEPGISESPAAVHVEASATPDEVMREAHRQIETALAQELLERVRASSPAFFERLIVRLLLEMGYGGSAAEAGRVLGRSGDDGVDGVIDQDPLGLDRVYVQAKRYAADRPVGAGAVRDFFGSLDRHKAAKGLFVTTSAFTGSARETAEHLSKRIVLIDGERLARLMIAHGVGCRIEDTLVVKKLDEDAFE